MSAANLNRRRKSVEICKNVYVSVCFTACDVETTLILQRLYNSLLGVEKASINVDKKQKQEINFM